MMDYRRLENIKDARNGEPLSYPWRDCQKIPTDRILVLLSMAVLHVENERDENSVPNGRFGDDECKVWEQMVLELERMKNGG